MARKTTTKPPKSEAKEGEHQSYKNGEAFTATEAQRQMVLVAVGAGVPERIMCQCVINPTTNKGIARETLRKHFAHELDAGRDVANVRVAAALFANAMSGNVASQIFWLKCQAGWKEPVHMVHDFADNMAERLEGARKRHAAGLPPALSVVPSDRKAS